MYAIFLNNGTTTEAVSVDLDEKGLTYTMEDGSMGSLAADEYASVFSAVEFTEREGNVFDVTVQGKRFGSLTFTPGSNSIVMDVPDGFKNDVAAQFFYRYGSMVGKAKTLTEHADGSVSAAPLECA